MNKQKVPPVVCVVGWSGSGKTTLVTGLVRELKKKGYRVGTVKHHHGDIELDQQGKDTWHHARAGADTVALAGATGFFLYKKRRESSVLNEIAALMSEVDIIIAEGFKAEDKPKIEVCWRNTGQKPAITGGELLAVVGDNAAKGIPTFKPDDIIELAVFLEEHFLVS